MTVAMLHSIPRRIFSGLCCFGPREGRRPGRRAGVTLVELMVSMAIIAIGIAGLVQSFGFIQKAVQASKNRTMASNLAQEKMQILKQKEYYQLLVTSDPVHNATDFPSEPLAYDTGYFPPEIIVEAGVTYTRYTYVQALRENGSVLEDIAPMVMDTGIKRITIHVVWGYGTGKRKVTMRSMLSNPATVMANVAFTGTVITTGAEAIGGALASLVESPGCIDTTNSQGKFYMNGTPGTYALLVTATGYYPALQSVVAAAAETKVTDFTLTRIATGRIEGYPWLKDHLVISQIVGSSINTSATPNFDQEYVEVFNPTTYTWTMDGNIGLKFQRFNDATKKTVQIEYLNETIPSGGYYLFANTGTIVGYEMTMDADAVWDPANTVADFPRFAVQNNVIPVDEDGSNEGCGALELYRVSDGATLDKVGWNRNNEGKTAPFYEAAAYSQGIGLQRNETFGRKTSTSGVDGNYGPAYDSNNNNEDISGRQPWYYSPNNSIMSAKPVISGTPAVGAVVSCSDGLSSYAEAANTGSHPYAYFNVVDVATGSWTVLISSGSLSLEQAGVSLASPGSVYTFGSTSTFLTQYDERGIVSGRVLNLSGAGLNGIVVTSGGANNTNTGSDGRYRLRVASGTVDITANPAAGGTASYVTVSSTTISVETGEVHSGVDFVLYQGGRLTGYVTRDGVNGLPGVAMAILDGNSVARDQQVSGTDGRFTSVVLSTGYYMVSPALGSLETSAPLTSTVTILTMGGTLFTSTFTITGAMGYLTGTVKFGGEPIKTGVLIVVTTRTLAGSPPAPPDISVASISGPPYYQVSSMENGTYLLEVRNSTNPKYNVYAYYPTPGATTVTLISSATSNVSIIAGQTTSGVDFSW